MDAPVAVAISGGIIGGLVSLSLRCRAVFGGHKGRCLKGWKIRADSYHLYHLLSY